MQFLGPNAADWEGDRWMMDELLTLTRQLKAKDEAIASLTQNATSLTQTSTHLPPPLTRAASLPRSNSSPSTFLQSNDFY